jgi:drug/metabolite transporter (DMT)-like permease
MNSFTRLSDNSQGIFYSILACLFASILIAIVRFLSTDFHIFFIVFMRNLFGLIFFFPQIFDNYRKVFTTKHIKLHLFRGVNGLLSMICWFYVITNLDMSEAVSISFTIPIITTIAAGYFLKEKISKKIYLSCFIGLIGILIILRPGFKEFKIAYIFSFISLILWVASNLVIKIMTKTEKPQTIVAYMSLIMLIISIPLAIPYFQKIDLIDIFNFAMLGLVSNILHIFVSSAYAKADLSFIQPFDFTRLIFTAIISYFFFGEIIDIWVLVGSLIIMAGVVIALPRKNKKIIPNNNIC